MSIERVAQQGMEQTSGAVAEMEAPLLIPSVESVEKVKVKCATRKTISRFAV